MSRRCSTLSMPSRRPVRLPHGSTRRAPTTVRRLVPTRTRRATRETMRRKIKKVLRARRRKSSVASTDTGGTNAMRSGSLAAVNASPNKESVSEGSFPGSHMFGRVPSTETEVDEDDKHRKRRKRHRVHRHRRRHGRHGRDEDGSGLQPTIRERPKNGPDGREDGEPRRVDFAVTDEVIMTATGETGAALSGPVWRPFPTLRGMSVKSLTHRLCPEAPSRWAARRRLRQAPCPGSATASGAPTRSPTG